MRGAPRQEAGKGIGRIGVHYEHEMHGLAPRSVSAARKESEAETFPERHSIVRASFQCHFWFFPTTLFFIIYFLLFKT